MNRSPASLQRVALLSRFEPRGGFSYGAPVLHDGDTAEEPLKSKLLLFEDGIPLRRVHERHGTIAGTGRGAYSHWGRAVVFSASDNSDPNKNGRTYGTAIDHAGQDDSSDDGRTLLSPPFHLQRR